MNNCLIDQFINRRVLNLRGDPDHLREHPLSTCQVDTRQTHLCQKNAQCSEERRKSRPTKVHHEKPNRLPRFMLFERASRPQRCFFLIAQYFASLRSEMKRDCRHGQPWEFKGDVGTATYGKSFRVKQILLGKTAKAHAWLTKN